MRVAKVLIFFVMFVATLYMVDSFQTNSSNYRNFPLVVSSGGDIANSSSYKTYTATGIIAGIINSSNYKNLLGFFYTWLLANGQSCNSAKQCEGGFCCSNVCRSSTCPVAGGAAGGSGSGGGGGGEGGGGGGGGGIVVGEKADFSVSLQSIKEKIALGESSERSLTFKNTGDIDLIISLSAEGIEDYMSISDNFLKLAPGEETDVSLSFIARRLGAFIGQMVAAAEGVEKSVTVILEFISGKVLFDVKLDIPSAYAVISPGDTLKTQMTLINVGSPEKVDVFTTYFIKDLNGNTIHEESETFAVEKQKSFPKSFKIPEGVMLGSYVVIAEVRYADSFAISSHIFNVEERKGLVEKMAIKGTSTMVILIFILAGILALFAYKLIPLPKKKG